MIGGEIGASEGIRTLDIHVGNVTLYQTELRSLPCRPRKIKPTATDCKPRFLALPPGFAVRRCGALNCSVHRGSGAPCGAVEIGPVKEKSEAVAQGDRRSRKRDNCQRQVLTPRTQISNPVLGLSALRFANSISSTRRGGAKQKVIHRLESGINDCRRTNLRASDSTRHPEKTIRPRNYLVTRNPADTILEGYPPGEGTEPKACRFPRMSSFR